MCNACTLDGDGVNLPVTVIKCPKCKALEDRGLDDESFVESVGDGAWLSQCCGMPAIPDTLFGEGPMAGVCSQCRDNSGFEWEPLAGAA